MAGTYRFKRFLLPLAAMLVGFLPILLFPPAAACGPQINCPIQERSCTLSVDGRSVELDITPRPVKAMQELTFRVAVSGSPLPDPPVIDLGMPGMEMGPNRVELKKTESGVYEGTGVIIRCPSGKTVWEAKVTVPGAGRADFVFDVLY
jgi:hypothetical protein